MDTNKILSYTSKDYDSIKTDLVDAIPALTDKWTSREDSDPGIALVKMMSAIGDMLCYNFDKQALEYYGPTVTQRKNAQKLFELVGYKMHWYRCATTQVELTYQTPNVPEYISFCKRVVDGEDPIHVYYEYRKKFVANVYPHQSETEFTLSMPPIIDLNANLIAPLPGTERETWYLLGEPSILDPNLTEEEFRQNSIVQENANWFAKGCKTQYTAWKSDNGHAIGLHTFINDPSRTIDLFANTSSSIPYSLIPTTENPGLDSRGNYNPTVYLFPNEPIKLQAIQGHLCSVQFTSNQLKNNCFYVPDSQLDETYMYLSYKTTNTNSPAEQTVFIKKVDNLLTYVTPDDEEVDILFQFGVDDFDYPYIELSSYWKNKLGDDTVTFTFYYFKTQGKNGNITSGYLNRINSFDSRSIYVTNEANTNTVVDSDGNMICSRGQNPQSASDAYVDSLNYIMTFDTLVTIYDFARFTRRQEGISNALAVDIQYAKDLNEETQKVCSKYNKSQLLSILGSRPELEVMDEGQLRNILYNIRKVNYTHFDDCVTVQEAIAGNPDDNFKCYKLNIYPIWENYVTNVKRADGTTDNVAYYSSTYTDSTGATIKLPYHLYGINQELVSDNNISDYLTKQYRRCKIANIEPAYRECRVFEWRCCGTVHLTKSVSPDDANNIVANIISTLAEIYKPQNVDFGQKITYMEVIEAIMSADSRIRYFDAGIGDKKLIDFAQPNPSNTFFNTEAYFNSESIMRYVQTEAENRNAQSPYSNYICVDPIYIQEGVIG